MRMSPPEPPAAATTVGNGMRHTDTTSATRACPYWPTRSMTSSTWPRSPARRRVRRRVAATPAVRRSCMPHGYAAADALGGLVEGLEQIPATCASRSPSTGVRSGRSGRRWSTATASTHGSATRTRAGSAARWRTSIASGGGGSHAAQTLRASARLRPTPSRPSSTEQRRRSLAYQSPATLYAALTVP